MNKALLALAERAFVWVGVWAGGLGGLLFGWRLSGQSDRSEARSGGGVWS